MRKIVFTFSLFLCFLGNIRAQCDNSEICNSNTGLYSNDDAASIEYDNIGSCYHATYIKEPNSGWKVWGQNMANNAGNSLVPNAFTVANYPALTGTIYKMGLASAGTTSQLIVLTSTGLHALGTGGSLGPTITTSATFQKITIEGQDDGLPIGVDPNHVKMMFTTRNTILITTCTGNVYALSNDDNVRGIGGGGSNLAWTMVMESPTQPLTNVIVARGNEGIAYALKADGTLWTWGTGVYLGDGLGISNKSFATPMVLPAGLSGIKMIQVTKNLALTSYYILGTDKKVYSLGENNFGQLGDRTTAERLNWVNAKNPDDSIITDAVWISANEHDRFHAGLAVLKTGGVLYTAGSNSRYMIGRTNDAVTGAVNFLDIPTGIAPGDVITQVEVGGHTSALIKLGSPRYGYVGHRVAGSMGNGVGGDAFISSYDFLTPPIIAVCGTICVTPTVTANSPICHGQNAVFTISGTAGDIVTYTINNGSNQTATIGSTGSVDVIVNNATADLTINLNFILGATGSCSNNLNISTTVTVNATGVTPTFTPMGSVCQGFPISLPSVSLEGIAGTWSPAINNMVTTTYTFTPSSGVCPTTTQMTVVVIPPNLFPTFNPIPAICSGDSFSLPAASLEGIPGTWTPAINTTQTTTYTFTPIVNSCAAIVQLTVVVNPSSTPLFTPVNSICEGSPLSNLPLVSNNGISGTWSPALNNQTTTTYTFTPSSGLCVTTAQLTIVVTPRVTPVFSSVDTSVCYGSTSFSLPLVSDNNIAGTWSPAFNNLATTTYTFTPTSGGCVNPTTLQIAIFDDFDFEYKSYCNGNNFILEVLPNDALPTNTATINWQYNNTTVGNNAIFDVTSYLNSTSVIENVPYTFVVSATANGCTKSKSITLNSIYCGIQKGISPGSDALNEFFDLDLLGVKKLSIFNRYGTKVYSKDNYKKEWNGQSDKGELLPDGTYYYVIDFENEASKTGWVYINREK